MSLARARGGLRCKWIVSIKTKWIAFPLRRFLNCYFSPPCWVIVVKCQADFFLSQTERKTACVKLHPHGYSVPSFWQCHLEEIRNFSLSVFLLCTDFMLQLDRGCGRYRQEKSSRQSWMKSAQWASRILPKCSALQNKVGQGHRPARYNYIVKLSSSLQHNGR